MYGAFFDAIYTHGVPVATGLAGHYIVCDGWAQEVDAELSAETRYAKLNYGWGPGSGDNGWFALRAYHTAGDGETIAADGKIFLVECFSVLPLQCGEIVKLSEKGPLPATFKWYEAPYWSNNFRNAKRHFQVVTFTENETAKAYLNLAAAAKSDANWIYTPKTEKPLEEISGRLMMEQSRANIRTAVLFPELLKRGPENEKLSIAVGLERLTYQKENDDGTFTSESISDADARSLVLALEDVKTGKIFYKHKLLLNKTKDEGRCTVTIPEATVPAGTVFRVLLLADESPADKGLIAIPLDTLAYAVKGITVEGCCPSTKTTYDFVGDPIRGGQAGALTSGTLPEKTVETLNAMEGKTVWLAVTIETDLTELTHDALWKPLTIASTEDAVAFPTIAFEESRLFLNNLNTPIAFTTTGDIKSVKAYLSQGSWLNEASRNGFELTADEMGAGAFKLAGRANTNTERSDEEISSLDAMTLDSPETVGRDAVLSLCATDAVGNVAWTHVRLTWGYSDEIIALATIPGREAITLYLDQLLYAALYAGSYQTLTRADGKSFLYPKDDSDATKIPTGEQMEAAMTVVGDAMRLGYAMKGASGQGHLLTRSLYKEILLGDKTFNPRVEILTVSPNEITFKMMDDTTSPETLAQYVDTSAITVEGGETLDAIQPLEGMSVTANSDGTYTLKVPEGKKFFQIKL